MGLQFVISGAFGIFRTDVLKTIGGHFPGTGEDLELTMRMRWLGWKVEFAYYSMALTDVPDNIKSFIKQTLRWDRDGIKTVYQKFAPHVVNPFSKHFNLMMAISVLDNFFVGWILIVMTYMFFIYLAASKGEGVILFTVVVYIFLIFIEFFSVLLTLLFVNKFDRDWRYLYYVPLYVLLKMFFYEPIRFISIWSELIFRHSYKDSFSPYKVQKILKDERG
jgi:cellulose synthase/poly-beta-1,6-N-acetylglucosamine synthase-like glycosyltransferase